MCVCSNAKEGGADPTAASSKTEEGGEYSSRVGGAEGRLEGRPRRSLAPLTLLEGAWTDGRAPHSTPPRPLSPVAFPPPHQEDFLTIPPPSAARFRACRGRSSVPAAALHVLQWDNPSLSLPLSWDREQCVGIRVLPPPAPLSTGVCTYNPRTCRLAVLGEGKGDLLHANTHIFPLLLR